MHWAQALVFCGCLMGASIYDVRHRLVDDRVCVALVLAGLITISPASFLGALAGGLPSTVTLLVTTEQAKVLAGLEQESELHLALVYRGTAENASAFIEAQDALIEELYAEPEAEETAETTENTETGESEGADSAAESEAAAE